MTFLLFDYLNIKGLNEFKGWSSKLQKNQKAKLDEKLTKLELYGQSLYPQLLTDSPVPGIQKLRITAGNVQLRPLLCRGPINIRQEYTLLMGAKEIGSEWSPKDAPKTANSKRQLVITSPSTGRIKHERVV